MKTDVLLNYLLSGSLLLSSLVSCTVDNDSMNEKQPISFSSNIVPIGNTASRSENEVESNRPVGSVFSVQIGEDVKSYILQDAGNNKYTLVASDGNELFYWSAENNNGIEVQSWYPQSETLIPDENINVKANQTTAEGLAASDFLYAEATGITPANTSLSFSHRVAKIIITLASLPEEVTPENFKLLGIDGVEGLSDGNTTLTAGEISFNRESGALLRPQTIKDGADFISFTINDEVFTSKLRNSTPGTDITFVAGNYYEMRLNIQTLEATITEESEWGTEGGNISMEGSYLIDEVSPSWGENNDNSYEMNGSESTDI